MLGRMLRWVIVSLLGVMTSLSLISPSLAQTGGTHRVTFETDIEYYEGPAFDPERHILDVYRPVDASNAPVLIFVHGGGWASGHKGIYSFIGRTFAERGYVTVVPNYRLSPAVQHPAHVRDVARAYAWTVEHIDTYGGDASRIVLSGHSAGGHLVSLLAVNERYLAEHDLDGGAIRGVIGISGVYDVTNIPTDIVSSQVLTSDPEARRDASPIEHVGANEPSFLLMHAQFDLPTLAAQAERFHERLIAQANESRLREIRRRSHSTIVFQIGNAGDPTTADMLEFLDARTRQPDVIGSERE